MGEMRVLTKAGDIAIEWDPDDADSVSQARGEWKRLKEAGYEFFEKIGKKAKRVTRFSKKLGKVVAAPGAQSKADKKTGKRPKAMAGGPRRFEVC